jgi:hypothetical protein
MPIFGSMGNVLSDQPTRPFIPLAVGSDGFLPDAPSAPITSGPASGTSSGDATAAPDVEAAASATPVASTSGSAWLVWLVCGLVGVAVLVAAGWTLTRNRAPRRTGQGGDTA